MRSTGFIIAVVVTVALGFIVWQQFFRDQYRLPSGETMTVATAVNTNGALTTKEIMITNDTKHSVPLDQIVSGGPPRDGIPSIDQPRFAAVAETTNVKDDQPGIAVALGDVNRFYPFNILVWHEIVNDTINGQRMLITFCPLCYSAIVFDPMVQGERVAFGTSGKLWNSNLVMYDRATDSLWSQVLGEAVVGEMTGTKLAVLPSDITRYRDWKNQHPDGEVLTRETGANRDYDRDPYGDYYTTTGVYFPLTKRDDRLPEKEFILGIVINGQAKAYVPGAVTVAGRVEETIGGKTVVAQYESDLDVVRLYEKAASGDLQRLETIATYWFTWAAVHPDTEVYK